MNSDTHRIVWRDSDAQYWDNCPQCGEPMNHIGDPDEGDVYECEDCGFDEVWVRPET